MGAKEWKYYYSKTHPEQGHRQIRSQQTSISTGTVIEMACNYEIFERFIYRREETMAQTESLTVTWPQPVPVGGCAGLGTGWPSPPTPSVVEEHSPPGMALCSTVLSLVPIAHTVTAMSCWPWERWPKLYAIANHPPRTRYSLLNSFFCEATTTSTRGGRKAETGQQEAICMASMRGPGPPQLQEKQWEAIQCSCGAQGTVGGTAITSLVTRRTHPQWKC